MESASESPSAWSDLMVLSDDSDLLSDEYISHNKQISPPVQNEMIEGESPRCGDVSAHVDRMSISTLCSSPPRLAATGHSSASSSSLSLLGPPLNNATLSPISPPAEFKDEIDFKDTEESDFKDTLRTEEGVDESGAESCSTLESYSNKLSNLVLQDTKQSLCRTPSVSTTWKFQSNPTVVPSSHLIVRPKPTRARTSVNAAPFQSTSSHRQSDINSNNGAGAGPGASDTSLPIYSAPIDTLDTHTRSRMRTNNSNSLMMAHVHEILNDLYATPTGSGNISITHDSLSLTRRRKKNRGSSGGAESAGLKHKASIASTSSGSSSTGPGAAAKHFHNSSSFVINIKKPKKSSLKHSHHQKSKHHTASSTTHATPSVETGHTKPLRAKRKHQLKLKRFKQTLCRLFTFKTSSLPKDDELGGSNTASESVLVLDVSKTCFSERALPPVPGNAAGGASGNTEGEGSEEGEDGACAFNMDFASSIEKVKDYGWYWGPISSEAAEKILSTEPDGSFIVRDSSDDHYIFSLTFKLNACVRHVRIEHYQGNFSFGSCTKFKSHTIVDFIENAVEHSRSGRYLFFLHRRPILGPMRVQLLHPVSRFKQVQSLQHMCRFVILKIVRKDHINQLPLPDRLQAYLNTPHYYCESSDQFDATAPTTAAPSEES